MTLRARTNSISSLDSNKSSTESVIKDTPEKQPKRIHRYVKLAIILVTGMGVLVLAFFLGELRQRNLTKNEELSRQKSKETSLAVHWAGSPVVLSIDGDKDSDACSLLSECFASKHFIADPINFPDNPLKNCHATLRRILRGFDSGFYFEGRRLVGFVSSDVLQKTEYSALNIYNVCVRREDRGKGIAKAMLPEYVKAVRAKRLSQASKLYVGLDVDFDTPTAVGAFSLYAKMGYNRWWSPCNSISYFDYSALERQADLSHPTNPERAPSYFFPMGQMILNRPEILAKGLLSSANGKVLSHYCMVMLYEADDFAKIGVDIKEAVQSALLNGQTK